MHCAQDLAGTVGDHPGSRLVPLPDAQACLRDGGREGVPGVGSLPRVADHDPCVREVLTLALRALVLHVAERRFRARGSVVAGRPDGLRDVQAAFGLQGLEDGPCVSTQRQGVAELDLQDPGDLLVPCVAPAARQHAPGDRVVLGHADVPVSLVAGPARPALHVLDDDRPNWIEAELVGQGPDRHLGLGPAALLAWREHPVAEAVLRASCLGVLERRHDVLAAAE